MSMVDEMLQQYQDEVARIDKQAQEAKDKAWATLQEQLKELREEYHQKLKDIRAISQKTKGGPR